jgi:hypothetical protein
MLKIPRRMADVEICESLKTGHRRACIIQSIKGGAW